MKMVWTKIKTPTDEESHFLSKRAVKKKFIPIFSRGHTRKGKELNQAVNCKKTVEKPLTTSQSKLYNQILDEQRMNDDPKAKSYKVRSKQL